MLVISLYVADPPEGSLASYCNFFQEFMTEILLFAIFGWLFSRLTVETKHFIPFGIKGILVMSVFFIFPNIVCFARTYCADDHHILRSQQNTDQELQWIEDKTAQ